MCPWWRKKIMSFCRDQIIQDSWWYFFCSIIMGISALYIILASGIWWIDGYIRQSTPLTGDLLLAIETTIAGVLLLLFLWLFKKHHIRKISHMKSLIAMILLGGFWGSWCFAQAVSTTESLGFVFVLIGLQPIFTILSSAMLLWEHPRGSFYAFAATTIFASILLTIGDTGFTLNASSLHSYIYAILTAIFWWTSTTYAKIVVTKNSHLYALGLRLLFTGLLGWVIVFISHEMIELSAIAQKISMNPFNIIFLIFVSDLLAYSIYYRGLQDVPATIATIFELAFPLTGFIIDYILYDSIPSPMKVVAAMTILMSIVILPHCHFIEEKHQKLLIQNT